MLLPPLLETSLDIQSTCDRVDEWMENGKIEENPLESVKGHIISVQWFCCNGWDFGTSRIVKLPWFSSSQNATRLILVSETFETYILLAGLPGFARDSCSKIISISAFYY